MDKSNDNNIDWKAPYEQAISEAGNEIVRLRSRLQEVEKTIEDLRTDSKRQMSMNAYLEKRNKGYREAIDILVAALEKTIKYGDKWSHSRNVLNALREKGLI